MLRRKDKGFTLIELLIVVAIIGIIAAIAIPNLLNAIDRGKQKRTMADMRSVGTAVESYAVDTNLYPRQSLGNVAGTIATVLQPTYIKQTPTLDGWAGDLQYDSPLGTDYTIMSYGKDKKNSSQKSGVTNDFDCDIIYQNGTFTAYPEGVQT